MSTRGPAPAAGAPEPAGPPAPRDRAPDRPASGGTRPVRRGLRAAARLVPAALVIGFALAGPLLAPHPIDAPVAIPYAAPAPGTPLGGDQLGRDVLSRLLAGGGELLVTSALVACLVTLLAATLGAVAALRPAVGRIVDWASDLMILLPAVLAVLLVVLSWDGGGRPALVVAATAVGLPYAVRVVAGAAAPIAGSGYVEAATAGGERLPLLVWREVLPNLRSTLLTLLGLRFVAAVYVVSTAAFLEVGPEPPAADWALMIRENGPGIMLNPWSVVAPSLAIGLLAAAVQVAASALTPRTGRQVDR
ncbi:ABC transporter permease [Streptosporangium canum]|uniref:ABC transporter permease n=1 Tax=Streptosporangium canum TaxID=324952 RepID=UPI0037B84417